MILRLSWTKITDKDLRHYVVKWSGDPAATWSTAAEIARVDSNHFDVEVDPGAYNKYFVKAVDTSGNESTNAAVYEYGVAPAAGSPIGLLLLFTHS